MDKVALVVQRYSDVTGGSEAEARAYAQLLRSRFEVEVITTTAKDVATWANELPPGESEEDGVLVRRFSVTTGRSRYWEALYDILLRSQAAEAKTTVAFQEEWIRRQGPHSDGLLAFLSEKKSAYRAFLYFTYLYSPAYFGTQCTPAERNILIPTLHDEPAARMTCFRAFAERTSAMIFNSEAEMKLAMELWNVRAGVIAGFPVACPERPSLSADSYVLYAGRIEPGKGCDEMFEYFAEFARANPGVRLVLIGKKDMKLPAGNLVEFAGFVTEEKKQELMARAICLLMPSRNESFSIVTLESMAAGVPVAATSSSPVVADHVLRSGCGRLYDSAESFAACINAYRKDPALRMEEGRRGIAYVREKFSEAVIRRALETTIDSLSG